ncbi:MAG TPA: DNA polymerase III subunit delta [Promineifilum sp.]
MFHLFHGQDTYSQRETLAALLAKEGDPDMLSLNTTHLGHAITFADLQGACDAMPFLARVRVVVVHDLLSSIPDKAFMEKLEAYLPALPETTRLIFLESRNLPENHRIIRLSEKAGIGFVRKFEQPRGGELERWASNRVTQRGGRITPQATRVLAGNIEPLLKEDGGDLMLLSNEIEKLVLYKGPAETIDVADVEMLSPYSAEGSIFELVDALGNRQAARTAELFQQKINEGVEPFYLFSMFIRQFRLLIQTKALLEAGERPPGIASQLNQRLFVAEKLARQARNYTVPQLEQIYRRLLDIDVQAKTGKTDLLTALHLLVAGLTLELD